MIKKFTTVFAMMFCLCRGAFATGEAQDPHPDWLPLEKREQARVKAAHERQLRQAARAKPAPPPRKSPQDPERPIHVIFTFVDHWEPGDAEPEASQMASAWTGDYARMAGKHVDADGCPPRHTWFCEFLSAPALEVLSRASFMGLGEMEIHIHHGTANDSGRDNTARMAAMIDRYKATLGQFGACLTAEPAPRSFFGFIHGKWALDNSRIENGVRCKCGVNQELDLLRAKGCYADFTFPAWGSMQPTRFSKILACQDSPAPKSYGIPTNYRELKAGGRPPTPRELVLIEGPGSRENIDQGEAPTLQRMKDWIKLNVHVPGRENWIFVKVHTHGAQALPFPSGRSNLVGPVADKFFGNIERTFNDGRNFQLHYVTARELYNIAMAAVDGKSGSPNAWRDYKIPRPANRYFYCNTAYRLRSYQPDGAAELEVLEKPQTQAKAPLEIWARDFSPGDGRVLERNSPQEHFRPSDARLDETPEIPLRLTDLTPSRFYRLEAAKSQATQ